MTIDVLEKKGKVWPVSSLGRHEERPKLALLMSGSEIVRFHVIFHLSQNTSARSFSASKSASNDSCRENYPRSSFSVTLLLLPFNRHRITRIICLYRRDRNGV